MVKMNVIDYITITCNLKNDRLTRKKYEVYWKLNKKICYEIQLLKTQKKSIKIKWQSQHDQKILFYV
jgi:Icc-related predicted phosphoesterase